MESNHRSRFFRPAHRPRMSSSHINRIARELNPLLTRSSRPCTVHYRSKNKLDADFSFYRLTVYYLKKLLYASFMAEGLGFEPSHNGFRDRRATATLALSMHGRDSGIRTHTERILSPVPLPIGIYPHRAYWGQGATPESS